MDAPSVDAVQCEIDAVAAAQQARYAGRPAVDDFQQTFGCDGHCNEIIPSLYLGDTQAAVMHSELQRLKIGAIVNCTTDQEVGCALDGQGMDYVRVPVRDEDKAQLLHYLDPATEFVQRHISGDVAVLVHCQRGVSRSASVVIAYLMRYFGMTRDEAYKRAKSRRAVVAPNPGFWQQLQEYQTTLTRQESQTDKCITFDEQWCLKSLAAFDMGSDSAFVDIKADKNLKAKTQAVKAALDFVLGRGIDQSDVCWLRNLIESCNGSEQALRILSSPEFKSDQFRALADQLSDKSDYAPPIAEACDETWEPLKGAEGHAGDKHVAERHQIGTWTYAVGGLLTRTECMAIINQAEARGFQLHRSKSRRQITFQSNGISTRVWHRLQQQVPLQLVGGGTKKGQLWELHGLSAVWRLTKYVAPHDHLDDHFDAVKSAGPQCVSAFTLTIYLNDVRASDGGATLFVDKQGAIDRNMHVASLQPRTGVGLVLSHDVWHSGQCLNVGAASKYILRSEVFYASTDSGSSVKDKDLGIQFERGDFEAVWPKENDGLRELFTIHGTDGWD